MDLTINQKIPGCADGNYHVKARGCIAASLHWADSNGALPDWQSFACLPIAPNGAGMYKMEGSRAIPADATHVLARSVSPDFGRVEEILVPIPKPAQKLPEAPGQRFLVMTDLHLSAKPWQVRKALAMGKNYDAVLITGDMTNDGTREQLELFWQCVTEVIPDTPVLAVTGNHDYPALPLPFVREGICDYPALQQRLLERSSSMGIQVHQDISGAYAAELGDTQIIGLNAATHWRRFKFPDNAQPEWLRNRLQTGGAGRYIVLCHAPPAAHRPCKEEAEPPYLSRDEALQQILDDQKKPLIFLSGHTHLSLNNRESCADRGGENRFYFNLGSIRPTTLKNDEPLQPDCWTEGNVAELLVGEREITLTGISLKTGRKIARGHYRFERE